jgi:hypothetical protein
MAQGENPYVHPCLLSKWIMETKEGHDNNEFLAIIIGARVMTKKTKKATSACTAITNITKPSK